MSNVIEFRPATKDDLTPREQAGVSMLEDMDMLLDCLMGAAVALKNSENVADEDRDDDMQVVIELFVKYVTLRGERYGDFDDE